MIWRQTMWRLCNKWLQHCERLTVVFVTNTYWSPSTWWIVRELKQVIEMAISDTNTSSQTFMPFSDASFVSDCLLQAILHVSHLLLQFADITDPLLSSAALFSRFYSHRIQTWAIKAASYLARWIVRSHMQYAIEISSNSNFEVTHGVV